VGTALAVETEVSIDDDGGIHLTVTVPVSF
jgi:hypothetical protein